MTPLTDNTHKINALFLFFILFFLYTGALFFLFTSFFFVSSPFLSRFDSHVCLLWQGFNALFCTVPHLRSLVCFHAVFCRVLFYTVIYFSGLYRFLTIFSFRSVVCLLRVVLPRFALHGVLPLLACLLSPGILPLFVFRGASFF